MNSHAPRLTGADLLREVESLGAAPNGEKARRCGYVRIGADGRSHVEFSAFYRALAQASGVKLSSDRPAGSRPSLRYEASVLTTGAILVGPRYVEQLGLGPGDQVKLEVSTNTIRLVKASA